MMTGSERTPEVLPFHRRAQAGCRIADDHADRSGEPGGPFSFLAALALERAGAVRNLGQGPESRVRAGAACAFARKKAGRSTPIG
jgi:hypothetical protein